MHRFIPYDPILVEYRVLQHVVISAAECEIVNVFHNVQKAIPIQYILNQIGHPQPATHLGMDNKSVNRFLRKIILVRKIEIMGYALLLFA